MGERYKNDAGTLEFYCTLPEQTHSFWIISLAMSPWVDAMIDFQWMFIFQGSSFFVPAIAVITLLMQKLLLNHFEKWVYSLSKTTGDTVSTSLKCTHFSRFSLR